MWDRGGCFWIRPALLREEYLMRGLAEPEPLGLNVALLRGAVGLPDCGIVCRSLGLINLAQQQ